MVAAPQKEDLATTLRQVVNRLSHDLCKLVARVEIFRGRAGGHGLSTHALDPRRGHTLVPQILQRPVLHRDKQVRARQAGVVLSAARLPEIEEQILNDVLRRIGRAHEA
jgi:hypothetical protein